MITFHFTGDPFPSLEEQQAAKEFFIEKLGPFKEEFEEKNGIVTFDYSYPATDNRRISFDIDGNYSLGDFIGRWNIFIKSLK
jgi:hypothetical protein